MSEKILIIDNGSYKCRVGFSDSTTPLFEFRNLIAKPRKDKKKEAPTVAENTFQIGDEIDIDAMRLLLKTQFERNVVTHPVYQEHIFDYILSRITPEGHDWQPQSILITEPLANPTYCRQTMNELFFECYGVPSMCYGIDSALAWQHNRLPTEENSLIVNFGYHTTHVVPILNGQLQHDRVRRLNLGGYQMISYLYRLLQMKYPAHLNAISWTRMEDIFHNHSSVAVDYLAELRKWDNMDYYNANVKKIQLPYTAPAAPNTLAAEEKLKRRKEMAKRLIEANQKRLREKKGEEFGSDTPTPAPSSSSTSSRNSKYQPPPNVSLETWLEEIKKKHNDIVEKKSSRQKRRQEMVKRHTLASQERMRIISLLASHDKGSDEFGKDDKDWDVYKKISHENESDSDAENEKLMEYEGIMKYHQASMAKDAEPIENTAELYQLHVGVESLRAPELLFQPSMIGMYETGVAELLKFVFDNFSPEDQQTLADNVFITGGCSQLPGLKNRLLKELQEMRPFQSSFSIKESKNASLDAWLGGKDLTNSPQWSSFLTTREDYMEKGTEYFKDYHLSNKYLITPRNVVNNT
ncbi:actin-related protein 5 [Musca vetustissima]|uniref:actin-related protein 5 n=1 Tax=Musca vetustissima TaxID=27455 RepID=UPI002AB63DE8|nr:actin-related protein 5 [Musca vetustissima]